MRSKSLEYWFRWALLILVAVLLFFILPVILPFIISLVLALILLPIVNSIQDYMRKKRGWTWFPRWLAIVPAFIGVLVISIIVVKFVILPVTSELSKLINNLPALLSQLMLIVKGLEGIDGESIVPHQFDGLLNMTINRVGNYSVELAQRGISAVFSLASALLQLLLVPIITFYLLKDGRTIKYKIINVFPERVRHHLLGVVHEIHLTLGGYLRGQLLLATNMFCIIFIVAYVYDLPYPLVLALLAGVSEWIPILGPFISAVPAIILASLDSGTLAAQVAITYGIIQILDGQVMMPKIVGSVINLHPLVIISVIFIGGYFYGIVGMMVAIPITAILQIIAKKLWYFNYFYKQ